MVVPAKRSDSQAGRKIAGDPLPAVSGLFFLLGRNVWHGGEVFPWCR
ncbi:hypothetical protein KCP70_18270 [Salmonella enterica subsp. enterica]|nr:hypothetical protein KCP70_18270 [Salmonella enterica subsp. enterica]